MLLILAAVSLSAVFSDKGIFSRAEIAVIKNENAQVYESLLVQAQNYKLDAVETGIESRLISKFREEDYIGCRGIVNMSKVSNGNSKTGNGNLKEGDVYVAKQIEENGDYYLFYYDKDNNEKNLGRLFENGVNDEYRLGFIWDDDIKKYYSNEYSENAFFIIKRKSGITSFRNNISLHVAKDVVKDENSYNTWKAVDWNHIYDEEAKSGYLCDQNGNLIYGWGIDKDTGDVIKDTASKLSLSCEIEGKERIGTYIDDTGNIYAKFCDRSKVIIGKICIATFACHNCLTMNTDNSFDVTMSSGEFDGIGTDCDDVKIKMKIISKEQENSINKHNRDIKNNNYTLSINPEKEYYFVLQNGGGKIIFSKNINLCSSDSGNAVTGQASGQAALTEECIPYNIMCNQNGNPILGNYVDSETGKLFGNIVQSLRIPMDFSQIIINEQQVIFLIKIDIKENGRIYGIYSDGKERLICAMAVATSIEDGNFDGVGIYPEEDFMTISKQ